jgi:hypothetical protein
MTRDMELIRKLLFYFEEKDDFRYVKSQDILIPGYEPSSISYHVDLMCEAGLLSCERITSGTKPDRLIDAIPFRLTWSGHEFLDAARNDSVWQNAMSVLGKKGISAAFGLLQALLLAMAKKQLGLK